MNALIGPEAFSLYGACLYHPLAYGAARLTRRSLGDVLKGHGHDLTLNVYSVEQRPGNLVHVTLNLPWRAHTVVRGVAIIATRTGVHRRHKHEGTRKLKGVFVARDGYAAVFKRLTQHLKGGLAKLWQLVGKEHTVVGQRDLAGLRVQAAANEGDLRYGVVGRTERSLRYERQAARHLSRHAVYLRCLQALGKGQRRQDGRQALCHHRLAAARRAHHDQVVAASRRHLKRTLHLLLSAHVGIVELGAILLVIKLLACVHAHRLEPLLTGDHAYHLLHLRHAVDPDALNHSCLAHVLLRHDKGHEAIGLGTHGYGQRSFDRLQRPVEPQLPDKHYAVKTHRLNLFRCREHPDGERQVEAAAFLAQVGRRHVYRYVGVGKEVAVVYKCCCHAVSALAHSRVAKTCHAEHDALGEAYLYGDGRYVKAVDGGTIGLYKHKKTVFRSSSLSITDSCSIINAKITEKF